MKDAGSRLLPRLACKNVFEFLISRGLQRDQVQISRCYGEKESAFVLQSCARKTNMSFTLKSWGGIRGHHHRNATGLMPCSQVAETETETELPRLLHAPARITSLSEAGLAGRLAHRVARAATLCSAPCTGQRGAQRGREGHRLPGLPRKAQPPVPVSQPFGSLLSNCSALTQTPVLCLAEGHRRPLRKQISAKLPNACFQ